MRKVELPWKYFGFEPSDIPALLTPVLSIAGRGDSRGRGRGAVGEVESAAAGRWSW